MDRLAHNKGLIRVCAPMARRIYNEVWRSKIFRTYLNDLLPRQPTFLESGYANFILTNSSWVSSTQVRGQRIEKKIFRNISCQVRRHDYLAASVNIFRAIYDSRYVFFATMNVFNGVRVLPTPMFRT